MDNSLRLQLLRTKRELQNTIDHIDNILFYNNSVINRNTSSRQFIEGLMNILNSRRTSNSSINTSPVNTSPINTSPVNESPINTSPTNINTSPRYSFSNLSSNPPISLSNPHIPTSNLSAQLSGRNINTSSNFSYPLYQESYYNSSSNVIPDLVEVTLYSQTINTSTEQSMEDVNIIPNINILSNSSSVHIYSTLNTTFTQCPICQENFTENSIVRKINSCDHIFHIGCIDTWFEENITCPVCRIDLRDTIIEGEEEEI